MTAHRCVFADGAVTGQTILVTGGAGAVGYYALQLAKWGGATVITTVSRTEQAELAKAAGADHIINYKTEDVVQRIKEITGAEDGRGADRVIDVSFTANLPITSAVIRSGDHRQLDWIGRSLTEAVLKRGYRVIATAHKPEQLSDLVDQYPEQVKAVRLDVTNLQEVREAVASALNAFDRIEVLVNNAGYGTMGAIEEVSDEVIRRQFETNVFGALNMMRAVLPHMRQQRSGHILNLSSVGGFVAFAGPGIYNGTKFALEGLSEALAKEVAPLGIKVTIVEPGAFRTDFNGRSLSTPDNLIDDYASTSGEFLKWVQETDGKQPGDPDKAAEAMIQAVESENPPLRLALGADAVDAISTKLESVKAELDAWKQVSLSTAFAGMEVGAIGG